MESLKKSLIQEWFGYDKESGKVTRKRKTRLDAHSVIEYRSSIFFMGKYYSYTTIIWIIYYDRWPNGWIDHRDRIKTNNKIDNLREVTPTQNQQNKAGYGTYSKGVTWRNRRNPWQAYIRVSGQRIRLGSFATQEEAAKAYRQACIKYHGEFACPV